MKVPGESAVLAPVLPRPGMPAPNAWTEVPQPVGPFHRHQDVLDQIADGMAAQVIATATRILKRTVSSADPLRTADCMIMVASGLSLRTASITCPTLFAPNCLVPEALPRDHSGATAPVSSGNVCVCSMLDAHCGRPVRKPGPASPMHDAGPSAGDVPGVRPGSTSPGKGEVAALRRRRQGRAPLWVGLLCCR